MEQRRPRPARSSLAQTGSAHQHQPPHQPPRLHIARTGRLLLPMMTTTLLVLILFTPSVLAIPYDGLATNGIVPLGDGGADAKGPRVLDGWSSILIEDIPPEVCNIHLKSREGTNISYTAREAQAAIYADAGRIDAHFQVVEEWRFDIYDRCTIERNGAGVRYHDPEARPYVNLQVESLTARHQVERGQDTTLTLAVRNRGTINATLNMSASGTVADWNLTWLTERAGTTLAPSEYVETTVQVTVPTDAPMGLANLYVTVKVENRTETGWVAFVIEATRPRPAPPPEQAMSQAELAAKLQADVDALRQAAEAEPADVEESAGLSAVPATVMLVALVMALAAPMRRRRSR